MAFTEYERCKLLAAPNIGPVVVRRLEENAEVHVHESKDICAFYHENVSLTKVDLLETKGVGRVVNARD